MGKEKGEQAIMTTMTDGVHIGPHAIKAYFDSQAEHWDRSFHHDPRKIRSILRVCDLHSGQRVLDAACGTGVLFPWLLARDPELVMGIDISEAMTAKAREKYRNRHLRIVTADYYHLEAGAFDRIILFNAYPHFFDKERLAKKTLDLLADGGRFVVAQNRGRHKLNSIHDSRDENDCSLPLEAAAVECRWFEPYFRMDTVVDTEGLYIISGEKRR